MKLFDPRNHVRSEAHMKIYAYYTLAYTAVDFTAAVLFIVGSILFFDQSTATIATWLFVIGSVFFGLRPMITLLREVAYIRAGDYTDAAAQ